MTYYNEENFIHVCIDEGGLCGNPKVKITKQKPKPNHDEDYNIDNFYYGYVHYNFIKSYIFTFNETYPNTPITSFTEDSDKSDEKVIKHLYEWFEKRFK